MTVLNYLSSARIKVSFEGCSNGFRNADICFQENIVTNACLSNIYILFKCIRFINDFGKKGWYYSNF
ncbi:MAG: hypothetical protein ACI9Y7_002774 [Dokdonia sp.]|jgi:hypothetical protein